MSKPTGAGLLVEAKGVLLGQAAAAVLHLASIRLVTELLEVEAYGNAALILAALALAHGMFLAPVLAGQLRFDPVARSEGQLRTLYAALVRLGLLALLAVSLVLGLVLGLTGSWLGLGSGGWLAVVMIGWLAANALVSSVANLLNATRRQGSLAALRFADGLFRPALGIVLILVLSADALPYVAGRTVGAVLLLAILMASARPGFRLRPAGPRDHGAVREWMGQLFKYGAPLVPLAGTQWMIHLADRYILEAFHGSAEVGVYAAAYGLASQPFLVVGASLTLLWRPRMFESARDSNLVRAYHARWLRWLIVIGGLGLLLLSTLQDPLAKLLLASAYRSGSGLFVIIGGAYLFLAVGQSYEVLLLVEERTRRVLNASLISTVVSIMTAMLLIPPFAAFGAAWSTFLGLASYTAATSLSVKGMRKGRHESD